VLQSLRDTGRLAPVMRIDGRLPAGGDPPLDVRLTLEPPLLAQVPWELGPTEGGTLATDPRIGVVYRVPQEGRAVTVQAMALQRALRQTGFRPGPVDGLVGPVTRDAVRAFQRSVDLPADGVAGRRTWAALLARQAVLVTRRQPRVLILRREADAELISNRGWTVGGHDLESRYRRASWDVQVPTRDDLAEFDRWIDQAVAVQEIDILHVSTTMDVPQTVPHLSFGAGESMALRLASRPQTLTVTALDRLVQHLSAAGVVPLVVLDIAAPPADSELLRQLLARNDFAHQLVALGHVETVLATAGSPDRLVELLTGGRTAAQIAGGLQSTGRSAASVEELLTQAGTALVSSVRPATMAALPVA
jgi:peptidoglycan hydrolase-like protein with peptidoglycan-binding domain